ncbi:MAG: tetraacyldisaccharide 4'-kinase, partial [Gemmatimonadota bacterium]
VARGYGRDELLLHREWTPAVPVVADPDRPGGVEEAKRMGATVVVLDDGFQHRRLAREVDVVLVAAEEGLPGALLPRGPFREPLAALRRAHAIVVTRKSETEAGARGLADRLRGRFPGAVTSAVHLAPGTLRPLSGTGTGAHSVPGGPVTVLTAVARPETVEASVREAGCTVRGLEAFPDHHEFSAADLARVLDRSSGDAIVVTEKDAVKLRELPGAAASPVWVLEQRLIWDSDPAPLLDLIARRIREGS